MPRTVTLTCDLCGASCEEVVGKQTDRAFCWIKLTMTTVGPYSNYEQEVKRPALWCFSCMQERGILPPKKGEQPPPERSLEELVRDWVGEVVREEMGNG